jgi:hypothetical protein
LIDLVDAAVLWWRAEGTAFITAARVKWSTDRIAEGTPFIFLHHGRHFSLGGLNMNWRRIAALCSALLVLGVVCAAPAMASWLDSVTPYNDGTTTWKGDTPFSSPDDPLLFGDVEWAVFAPSQTLPFSGYARPAGQFTYVYEFCNGVNGAAISYYGVVLQNTIQAIGWTNDGLFGSSLVEPDSASIASDGSTANWYFSNLAESKHSSGLVYSSPSPPTDFFGIVINNGDVAIDEPIPSPAPGAIPEPATIWLLLGGLGAALAAYWRRR